jgi:hypothetical protein
VSAEPPLLAKISRVTPPASAAIPAPVSSARSAVDVIAAEVAVPTVVADVPTVVVIAAQIEVQIEVQIVAQTVAARAARDSNAVPAVPVAHAMIAAIAIPARRAVRNSFPKCSKPVRT